MSKKGISPLISVVLLIAFTIAVGGILSVWLTTLATTQTEKTSETAEKQIACAKSFLKIEEVMYGSTTNVTIRYPYGTENLYNFSMTFVDINRQAYTVSIATNITPQYNDTAGQRFEPGMIGVWNIDTTSLTGGSLTSTYVSALCQKTYPVSAECKSSDACMV